MKRRLLLTVLAVPAFLLLVTVLYLALADLSGYRDRVARSISEATGVELTLEGQFEPSLVSLSPGIALGRLSIADPAGGDEPPFIQVEDLEARVALGALLLGRIEILELRVREATVRLIERDGAPSSWETGPDEDGPGSDETRTAADFPVRLGHAVIDGIQVIHDSPDRESPLTVALDRIEIDAGPRPALSVNVETRIEESPVHVSGSIPSLGRMAFEPRDVRFDLQGSLGDAAFSLDGTLADLHTLSGPDLEATLAGSDLASLTSGLGWPSIGGGSFDLSAATEAAGDRIEIEMEADLPDMSLSTRGWIRSLTGPFDYHLSVSAEGSSLRETAGRLDIENLPGDPFEVEGVIRSETDRHLIEDAGLVFGDHSLSARGTVGVPPGRGGGGLDLEASGGDLAAFSAAAGVILPAGPYIISGRVLPAEDGWRLQDLEGVIDEISIIADGTVGEPPDLSGTDLEIDASGPALKVLEPLAGIPLPDGMFDVRGRVVATGASVEIAGIHFMLEDHSVIGTVVIDRASFPSGIRVEATAEGPDLENAARRFSIEGFPAEPYDARGTLEVNAGWIDMQPLTAGIGEAELELVGRLDLGPRLQGTDLRIDVSGPRPSALNDWIDIPPLPQDAFEASGRLRLDAGVYRLDGVVVDLGPDRLTANGDLDPEAGWERTDLALTASGPDLSRHAPLVVPVEEDGIPEGLPAAEFELEGRLLGHPGGYELRETVLRVADGLVEVEGTIGTGKGHAGTDLSVTASGPDASILGPVIGRSLPALPFRMTGGVARQENATPLRQVSLSFGKIRAEMNGVLGDGPWMKGTSLDIRIEGPSLAEAGQMTGNPRLPAEPFSASALVDGSRQEISLIDLEIQVGGSDLRGSLEIERRDRVRLSGSLHSGRLDLTPWLTEHEAVADKNGAPEGTEESQNGGQSRTPRRLISDEPIPADRLRAIDADLTLEIDEIDSMKGVLHDARLRLTLHDGNLEVNEFSALGRPQGTVGGTASLEPRDSGWHLDADVSIEGVKLGLLAASEDPNHQSPTDMEIQLTGAGESPHAIAAGADGRLLIVQGPGRIDLSILDILGADLLGKIFDALNPFNEKLPYTELECTVILGNLEDGGLDFDALAMRTDKVTIVGSGRIDLEDEKLDLEWTAKPRKGVGLSVSGITNPYVKVGGTLADPGLTIKPLSAVVSTGAAVLTGGLSFLARGLWDRITAEKNVCQDALEEAREQLEETRERLEQTRRDHAASDG